MNKKVEMPINWQIFSMVQSQVIAITLRYLITKKVVNSKNVGKGEYLNVPSLKKLGNKSHYFGTLCIKGLNIKKDNEKCQAATYWKFWTIRQRKNLAHSNINEIFCQTFEYKFKI